MKITRRSMFTSRIRTMDLPVTLEQIEAWESGTLVQDAFPNLTPDEREFIMSGVTPDEWAAAMDDVEDREL